MNRLDHIFKIKREEVAARKSNTSFADLKAALSDLPPTRGFLQKLFDSAHSPSLIAEVKAASPSQGVIREDFDPVEIAGAYVQAGADCLSVLTDATFFKGSPENIARVRTVANQPILCKDFIDDRYQIHEARVWGADCILLIVASLEKSKISDLYGDAVELGLDVLVEVHSQREAEIALELGCPLVGVNNRDLATFETNLGTSEQILPLLKGRCHAVSESALSRREDVRKVSDWGARTVLIGTAFCGSQNVESKVREVMGW